MVSGKLSNAFLIRIISCFLLTSAFYQASSQTKVPASDTTESKLKYIGKIGDWYTLYQYSSPAFLENEKNAFKSKAFVVPYIEGLIDHKAWMFGMLNDITQLRYKTKQEPNLFFELKFKPNASYTAYQISLRLHASTELSINLGKISTEITEKHFSGKEYADPAKAEVDLSNAVREGMNVVASQLGDELAPKLMVRYQDEIFWNGHTINVLTSEGNYIELEALQKDGTTPPSSQLTWAGADPYQSKGVVNMTGVTRKTVTVKKGKDQVSVTLVRVDATNDLRDLLKRLLMEALTEKKKQASDSVTVLRTDSINNNKLLSERIAKLEAANFPMETGSVATPLFAEGPRLMSSADVNAFESGVQERGIPIAEK